MRFPTSRRLILTLALVGPAASAQASPLRYEVTDLGQGWGGRGLDGSGNVVDEPERNIVAQFNPDHPHFVDSHGQPFQMWSVVDGTRSGLLLVNASPGGSSASRDLTQTFVFDPNYPGSPDSRSLFPIRNWSGDWTPKVYGTDMNENGDVVGMARWIRDSPDSPGSWEPLYAPRLTQAMRLAELFPAGSGWTPTYVAAINDRGQILGSGTNPDGVSSVFLLTPAAPVPEPGTWIVFGLAAAAFGVRARRRSA